MRPSPYENLTTTIFKYLNEAGAPKTLAQITADLDAPKKSVEKAISGLEKSGRVTSFKDENPLYAEGVKFQRPICRFFKAVAKQEQKGAWQPRESMAKYMPESGTDRMLRRKEVEAITGRSRSAIYEGMAAGTFPKPVKIGARAVAWPESVIRAWIAERVGGAYD